MKRLSGRFGIRKLIAVTSAGVLLSAGLGVAGASAADRASSGTPATKVPMLPCVLKYAAGNLYVGAGNAVYKVGQQTGNATTIAPRLPSSPFWPAFAAACGTAVDGAGNVLVADDDGVAAVAAKTGTFYGKKMVKGKLYVIAGVLNGGSSGISCDAPDAAAAEAAGPAATKATQANLGYTIGTLRFDSEGNIILADSGGDGGSPCGENAYDVAPRVAVIPAGTGTYYGQKMTVGDIYAIAGLGKKTANGVPAVDSDLSDVSAVALDHSGNILVATTGDFAQGPVRVIAARSGTFYGQKMIKGDSYALPGLTDASSVAVDAAGNGLHDRRQRQGAAIARGLLIGLPVGWPSS
jgi:hypothetical protein